MVIHNTVLPNIIEFTTTLSTTDLLETNSTLATQAASADVNTSTATDRMPSSSNPVLVIAVAVSLILLLLLLVGVVVVVLVLWRCRHQHTAKEEASHISSQTHTHPVVSLCEETGQVQYVSEQQDSPSHTYSSIQNPHERRGTEQEYSTLDLYHGENQVQRNRKGAKQRQEEETEMQEYSTVYHGDRPSQTRRGAGKGPENPLSESVYDQIDQPTTGTGTQEHSVLLNTVYVYISTGADALDKVMKMKKIKSVK